MSRILLWAGSYREALDTAVVHPALETDRRWLLVEGEAFLALERHEKARAAFNHAIEHDSASGQARRGLARADLEAGKTHTARSQIDIALIASVRDLEALVLKGELELAERRADAAAAAFRCALEIDATPCSHLFARLMSTPTPRAYVFGTHSGRRAHERGTRMGPPARSPAGDGRQTQHQHRISTAGG